MKEKIPTIEEIEEWERSLDKKPKIIIHPNYQSVREGVRNAFRSLRSQGIVARMNYDYMLTDGSYALAGEAEAKKARGYAFFHGQQEESFRRDGELRIAYGGAKDWYENPNNLPENALTNQETGELVSRVLKEQPQLSVIWDNDSKKTIKVKLKKSRRK